MSVTYYVRSTGHQPLRYAEGGEELERARPCWRVCRRGTDLHVADLFEIEPGSFELWHDGEMTEASSIEEALKVAEAAAWGMKPFSDEARHALKLKLDAIDEARAPIRALMEPLKKAMEAIDALHDAAVEEAGVELLDEVCEGCDKMLIAGDLGHRAADGPVLCEACAPTWADLLAQYRAAEPEAVLEDPDAHLEGLALAESMVAKGRGDDRCVETLS